MLKILIEKWRTKTPAEKIKLVLDFLVHSGGAIIGGDIAAKVSEGKRPLARVCVGLAGAGLGAAIGDTAAKPITEAVDQAAEAIQLIKEAREKGESTDA